MGKEEFKEKFARIRQESENRRQRDSELAVTEGKDFYDKIKINAVKKLSGKKSAGMLFITIG